MVKGEVISIVQEDIHSFTIVVVLTESGKLYTFWIEYTPYSAIWDALAGKKVSVANKGKRLEDYTLVQERE